MLSRAEDSSMESVVDWLTDDMMRALPHAPPWLCVLRFDQECGVRSFRITLAQMHRAPSGESEKQAQHRACGSGHASSTRAASTASQRAGAPQVLCPSYAASFPRSFGLIDLAKAEADTILKKLLYHLGIRGDAWVVSGFEDSQSQR
ncbi:unnamed protein product [Symbiodinium natans]|uniref:Uncharacterized protein n=1 Tax=Symbiodinium natans TaxID=878477 RepID=A0A812N2D3_9DINO|nr:unnamed protein product [Symbiodinium natans]